MWQYDEILEPQPIGRMKFNFILLPIAIVIVMGVSVLLAYGQHTQETIYPTLINLILVIPSAWLARQVVEFPDYRNSLLRGLLGLLLGWLAYGAFRYAEYYFFQQVYRPYGGDISFREYLNLAAEVGYEETRRFRTRVVQGDSVWFDWAISFALITFLSFMFSYGGMAPQKPQEPDY
jgi:hypothetical protein